MNQIIRLSCCVCVAVGVSACAPINTQFSCNATAGDRCLSIEEVNAMTEMHDEKAPIVRSAPPIHQTKSGLHKKRMRTTQTIWMAPWTDNQGIRHENDTLFAAIDTDKTTT